MKVALTGATGLLGQALSAYFRQEGHTVQALSREHAPMWHPEEMSSHLQSIDCLIHAAANTNVEACETSPDECYRDNWALSASLARAAALSGTRMVLISSTGIYGQNSTLPYCEYDPPQPTTHHHRSKYLAELSVMEQSPINLVIRTGWLFGGSPDNQKNFVANRIREALKVTTGQMYSNSRQFGCPTFTRDVASAIETILGSGHSGIFNCVNDGVSSRYDYVKAIIELAELPIEVLPVDAAHFNRAAKVSDNESARNWRMRICGLPEMQPWRKALGEYVQQLLPQMRSH